MLRGDTHYALTANLDRNVVLPDPRLLMRIEEELWTDDGTVPPDVSAVVRGAPINGDKLFLHSLRQAREHSLRGTNMASLSVDLVLPGWPLDKILAGQIATYPGMRPARSPTSAGPASRCLPRAEHPTPTWCSHRSLSWRQSG